MHDQPRRRDGRYTATSRAEAAMVIPTQPPNPGTPPSSKAAAAGRTYEAWRQGQQERADSAFDIDTTTTAPAGAFGPWGPVGPNGEDGFEAQMPDGTTEVFYVDVADAAENTCNPLKVEIMESDTRAAGLPWAGDVLDNALSASGENPVL